jgi:hypothetical protein
MQLRILRRFDWINTSELVGGKPVWSQYKYDVLQYLGPEGVWVDVPIVEEEVPLNPDEQLLADKTKEFENELKEALKDAEDTGI